MKTKTDIPVEDSNAAGGQLAAYMGELKTKGHTILSAASRDELAEMLNSVPADCRYTVGAVGHCVAKDVWTLRIDIIK